MDFVIVALVGAFFAWQVKAVDQGRRVVLLARHLGNYRIEKMMESLTEGYLRALGEADEARRQQIFVLLQATERDLLGQFQRFVRELSQAAPLSVRVGRLPFWLPFASRIPGLSFDLREVMAVHAAGIARAVEAQETAAPRERAYTLCAELLLMQHTCHWYCRSRHVASARLLLRHKTSYEQVLASVSPQTRDAYAAITGVRLAGR